MKHSIIQAHHIRLFKSDILRVCHNTIPTAIGLWIGYICIIIIQALLSDTVLDAIDRNVIITLFAFFFSIYLPYGGYRHIYRHHNDIIDIMLPVERHIKFLSMIMTGCMFIPVTFLTALHLCDIVLSLTLDTDIAFSVGIVKIMKTLFMLTMVQSIFILGNIIFRKHKIIFPAVCLLLLLGIMIFLQNCLGKTGGAVSSAISITFFYLIPACMYAIAYQRFKNIEL